MKKIILLTGVTGFVGRQVLSYLAHQDVLVRVVVRDKDKLALDSSLNIDEIITTPDLFSESVEWWASVCSGVDSIIHVAWYAEPGKYLQSPKNMKCLSGTLKMAEGAVQAGIKRFIGIGTCFEYDLTGGFLSIDTPLLPLTTYAGTKAATYFALLHYFEIEKISFAWCRLFYLYGEGEDNRRLVPYIRKMLSSNDYADLGEGTQVRDFLDVKDASRMIVDVAFSCEQGAFNICSGVPITVRQLAEKIADEYDGGRKRLRFGRRPSNIVDPPCVVGVERKLSK